MLLKFIAVSIHNLRCTNRVCVFSGNIQFKLFHKFEVREKTISYFTDLRWLFTVTKDSSEKYLTSASSSLTSSCRQGRISDSTTLHGEVEGGGGHRYHYNLKISI